MSAKKKFDPVIHDENPEWTEQDFANSRPAEEMPPEILAQFKNRPGRPKLESPKEPVKIRLDADVVAALRKTGPGWQTRVNEMLRVKLLKGKTVKRSGSAGAVLSGKPKRQNAHPSKRKRA